MRTCDFSFAIVFFLIFSSCSGQKNPSDFTKTKYDWELRNSQEPAAQPMVKTDPSFFQEWRELTIDRKPNEAALAWREARDSFLELYGWDTQSYRFATKAGKIDSVQVYRNYADGPKLARTWTVERSGSIVRLDRSGAEPYAFRKEGERLFADSKDEHFSWSRLPSGALLIDDGKRAGKEEWKGRDSIQIGSPTAATGHFLGSGSTPVKYVQHPVNAKDGSEDQFYTFEASDGNLYFSVDEVEPLGECSLGGFEGLITEENFLDTVAILDLVVETSGEGLHPWFAWESFKLAEKKP